MSVYAESSAVVAWLLDEDSAAEIRRLLSAQDLIVASDLALIECDRVITRAAARGSLTEAGAHWHVLRISPEILDRARRSFPGEPIRTLDAIHLASAARATSAG